MMESNNGMAGGTEPSMDSMDQMDGGMTGSTESRSLVDRGKDQVRTRVDDQKAKVARTLSSVASSLKTSSLDMQTGDAAAIGNVVDRVADQVERAANYLERSNAEEIVGGVERFARRNPALFIGAAFAVGLLGARFLKSSSRMQISSFEGGVDTPGMYGDREVPTTPIGGADLSTGTTGTGTVTGSSDLSTGLE
jgi:ElaB/YqjD/DUF883 family membrane-anchored ribosome-binding protein